MKYNELLRKRCGGQVNSRLRCFAQNLPMSSKSVVTILNVIFVGLYSGGVVAEVPDLKGATAQSPVSFEIVPSHPINPMLFGQFLEIASWGEPGPEGLGDSETGALPSRIVADLRALHAPIIRFPGGSDVDYLDWRDRIGPRDKRPESKGKKGDWITNAFGYPEFLQLAETLDAEPLLVLNLRDVLLGEQTPDHLAGLVAYCNAEISNTLPQHLQDRVKQRVADGRSEPWDVRYWQIGNEMGLFPIKKIMKERFPDDPERQANWLIEQTIAIADALRAVDPDIEFIFDARTFEPDVDKIFPADPRFQQRIKYLTMHEYYPGGTLREFKVDGEPAELTEQQIWYALVCGPGYEGPAGEVLALDPDQVSRFRSLGYRLACTEWNFNGWGGPLPDHPVLHARLSGVGAAGFLHGLIRQGDVIDIATQSMMLGQSWNIGAIRVNPEGDLDPFITPSGMVTALYSQFHGDEFVLVASGSIPFIEQDVQLKGWGDHRAVSPLPLIDIVVTRSNAAVFVHVINRSFDQTIPIEVDLSRVDAVADGRGEHHAIVPQAEATGWRDAVEKIEHPIALTGARLKATTSPMSVNVFVVERKSQ